MAGAETDDIMALRARLAELQSRLQACYAAFGASCAVAERTAPLGACRQSWQAYDTCLQEYTDGQRAFRHLRDRLERISDARTRIAALEDDLKQIEGRKTELASRLGEAAHDAIRRREGDALEQAVGPLFREHARVLDSASRAPFGRWGKRAAEKNARKVFVQAGRALLAGGGYRLVPDAALVGQVDALLDREAEDRRDLENDRKSLAEAGVTDKGRLEEAGSALAAKEKQLSSLAAAYGEEVFEQITPQVIQRQVGDQAVRQALAVLDCRDRIDRTRQAIDRREGERQAEEIEAQIALDKQKVRLLEERKQELDRQISAIYGEINEKKRKVFKLRGAVDG